MKLFERSLFVHYETIQHNNKNDRRDSTNDCKSRLIVTQTYNLKRNELPTIPKKNHQQKQEPIRNISRNLEILIAMMKIQKINSNKVFPDLTFDFFRLLSLCSAGHHLNSRCWCFSNLKEE